MKKILTSLALLAGILTWAGAQEAATALQVAPSDQIKYPDASQLLNITAPPAPTPVPALKTLPSVKPLVASKPVPATALKAVKPMEAPGWYLEWQVPGDEAAVRAWAQGLNLAVQVTPAGEGLWDVVAGPFGPADLPAAWKDQEGRVSLVRR